MYIAIEIVLTLMVLILLYRAGIIPIPFGMVATTLSDLDFQETEFKDSVAAKIADKVGFMTSGILVPDNSLIKTGKFVEVPHYNKLTGDEEQIQANTDLTINNIDQWNDLAVWITRGKAWGSEDWTKWIAGENPMDEIANQVAGYWARAMHTSFLKILRGIYTTALAGTHSTGVLWQNGTIDIDPIASAKLLLGDNDEVLSKAIMHSKVWYDALKKRIAEFQAASTDDTFASGKVPQLLGMGTWKDDNLTPVAGKYYTYFSAPGAGVYAIREQNTEADRLPLKAGGTDVLVTRMDWLVHVPGVKWNNTNISNPTNAQLATDTNWFKVESENRNIQIVELITE